ncbi:hypothetical protein JKF63_01776 [Porcisia hertigi]|uniref:Uncharacterized protein n=1 Tax=Porcisia hertigi TaxID=2761500 RepID=A0A836HLS8_9TRYP|nr:hypothetical protein JKF63_01776 [Porcisia hertigi]
MRLRPTVFVVPECRPPWMAPVLPFTAAFRTPFRLHSNCNSDVRSTNQSSTGCSGSVTQPDMSETTTGVTKSPVAEAKIPEHMILDWSGGSAYYFSKEEKKRLSPSNLYRSASGDCCRQRTLSTSHTQSTTAATEARDDAAAPMSRAVIRGVARNFTVDLSIPPVRREEVERWKLDSPLFSRGVNATTLTAQACKYHCQLLPSTAMVTYLGPEMRKIDQLHRQKGFFTPSEIAEVFIPLVPTFPVESRHVMALVPPAILRRIEKAARLSSTLAQVVFEHYPMLFHYSPSRYRRALVQLNSEFWFVRQHPGYGKADRVLAQFRSHSSIDFDALNNADKESSVEPLYAAAEKAASEAAPPLPWRATGTAQRRPWGVEMLAVLLRNLPRVPTPKSGSGEMAGEKTHSQMHCEALVRKRYQPMNLVKWISSFPPNDLAFVNKVHEKVVVQLITQYVHVFQLTSLKKGDHNLFVEAHVLLAGGTSSEWRADASAPSAVASSAIADNENPGNVLLASESSEESDEMTLWWSVKGADAPSEGGPGESPPGDNDTSTAEDRERAFRQAVTEELIDLDAIAQVHDSGATALDSEAAAAALAGGSDEMEDAASAQDEEGEFNRVRDNWGDITPVARNDGDEPLCSQLKPSQGASMVEVTAFGLPLEEVYVRRLPPDVAPRSLSDLDETTSPDPELLAIAASFLAPPPSLQSPTVSCLFRRSRQQLQKTLRSVDEVWRWVAVQRLYAAFTTEQRRYLRDRYRGLVGFLRYHGKVFELSADLMYVIAHDPKGTMAPFPPMERAFRYSNRVVLPDDFDDNPDRFASLVGETERKSFLRVLGEGTIPAHRRHLLLLDPHNPLMQHEVLYDEIANLLPDHPVPLAEMMSRLPPVIRAALPHTINIAASKSLETYVERGRSMIRKRTSTQPTTAPVVSGPQMSVEEAIAELLQLPIGRDGVSIKALLGMHLSVAAAATLADHFGSVGRALRMLPQYFEVWEIDNGGRKRMSMVRLRQ